MHTSTRSALAVLVSVLAACGSPLNPIKPTPGPVDPTVAEGASFEVRGVEAEGGGLDSTSRAFDSAPGAPAEGGAKGTTGGTSGGTGTVPAGVLTAGVWDDNLNQAFFFAYKAKVASLTGLPAFTDAEQAAALAASGLRSPKTSLDIALVVDTTGSMGDEISYLQAEFLAISSALQTIHPGVPQRWALVDYRDTTDAWVVRGVDFGTSVSWFQQELNRLQAGGGGDFPEAPDLALAQAGQLAWNPDPNAARLVFLVADAPHHDSNAPAFATAVRGLQSLGVHVYPVASSGVDELTEYGMRAAAQLTLGRYLFLTDDSGVGGAHKEPSIPCYWVTKLAHAMERVAASELAGSTVDIDPSSVIRSSGAPVDGACTLADGAVASIF